MGTPCGPRNCQLYLAVWWEGRLLPYAQQGLGSSLQHQMVAAKYIQSGPLRPALKGAPMDTLYHSKIGIPHAMIEVMNHIKVQLKSTGRSENSCSQYNECVTAMKIIPIAEIMCRVDIADQSDKAPATNGTEAGNIIKIITIEATIMSLTLRYQSIDCLQAS